MAEMQWEKDVILPPGAPKGPKRSGRWKFLIVGVVILGAIGYLLFSSTLIGARYYMTVDELLTSDNITGKTIRVSGAVDGDPIYDPATKELRFVVANIPNDNDAIREKGGLAAVLYYAVNDPDATRLQVVAHDQEIPDLLKHEAQAIMSGKLEMVNGEPVFYAEEITLKCPTKYEEEVPDQVVQ
ncbi:MAG: cytochrome c maturation protein CcmE [Chloroflexi bacterium]|nr:MAG: cytochrome c maturation protein CcmE [Chloroflexota bacterium]